jgi:hypothetical protein
VTIPTKLRPNGRRSNFLRIRGQHETIFAYFKVVRLRTCVYVDVMRSYFSGISGRILCTEKIDFVPRESLIQTDELIAVDILSWWNHAGPVNYFTVGKVFHPFDEISATSMGLYTFFLLGKFPYVLGLNN